VVDEVVLEEPCFNSAVLLESPFFISAAGLPVGDVALRDHSAVFTEGFADAVVRDVIAEHAINHVAKDVWEASDFAVAQAFAPRGGRVTSVRCQGNGRRRGASVGCRGGGRCGGRSVKCQG
jgi:hypothetical protein